MKIIAYANPFIYLFNAKANIILICIILDGD